MVAQTALYNQFIGFDGKIHQNESINRFGTVDCVSFRDRFFKKYRPLSAALHAEYQFLSVSQSHVQANLRLLEIDQTLQVKNLNLVDGIDRIETVADNLSKNCRDISSSNKHLEKIYELCCELASSYRVIPPDPQSYNQRYEPCVARLCCKKWWKRQLSKMQKVVVESIARDLQQVHNKNNLYCSNISLNRHKQQKSSNREYLESQIAINEEGQEYTLAELSDLGVSNPTIRRTELITRIKGFEIVAKDLEHEGFFITLTCPSRFHRMSKITKSGKLIKVIPNKTFDESTPREGQKYLSNLWSKINSKLKREGIRPYGVRVAEPHHDGTPHWHFLLFVESERSQEMVDVFHRWSLKDSPDEKGAKKHRCKVEKIKSGINPRTGKEYSATGYVIKYICKNVDGNGVDNQEKSASNKDWEDKNPIEIAERIEAWARTFRIRQFQQIGGPSVTVWREMRRLSEQEGLIEDVRTAAKSGDWAGFVRLMGGPSVARDMQLARPTYALSDALNKTTGEVEKITHTCYGDEAKERVVGVLIAGITVLSRIHLWEIKENEKIISARQKIMAGVVDLLEEIRDQSHLYPDYFHSGVLQQAKPAALDLFQ